MLKAENSVTVIFKKEMITTESAKNNQTSQYAMPNATINYDETATVTVQRNEPINTLPPNYSQAVNTVAGVNSNNYPPQTIIPSINEEYKRQQKFNCLFGKIVLAIFCSVLGGALAWFIKRI